EVRGVAAGLEGRTPVGREEPDGHGMEEQREKKPAEPAPPERDEARQREGGEGPVVREEEPSPLHAVVERAGGADPPRPGQALGPTEEPALGLGRGGGRDDPPDGGQAEADSGDEDEPRDGDARTGRAQAPGAGGVEGDEEPGLGSREGGEAEGHRPRPGPAPDEPHPAG